MSRRLAAFCCLWWMMGPSCLFAQEGLSPEPDPLPVRRVLVPAADVPQELDRVRKGVLIALPLCDLEKRLDEANRSRQRQAERPRLVRATYAAQLRGTSLVQGRGQWQIRAVEGKPAILPLGGFNLALSRAKTTNGADAVLGEFASKELGVVVDKDAEILFDWSARGTAGPEGTRFDLRLPPAPNAVLELQIPSDHHPLLPEGGGLLVGPLDADKAGWRTWRIGLTGKARLDLLVRRSVGPEKGSVLLLSQTQSRFDLAPGSLKAEFEFQLEILHAPLKELVFACEGELEPFEISARNVDVLEWEHRAAPGQTAQGKETSKSHLVIRLRDPFQGNIQSLRIACLGTFPAGGDWQVPGLWLNDGISRGERLILRLEGSLGNPSLDPGDFKVGRSLFEGKGNREVHLEEGRIRTAPPKRPRWWWPRTPQGPTVRQTSVWRPGSDGQVLETDLEVPCWFDAAASGTLRLPAGGPWRVEKLDSIPAEVVEHWEYEGRLLRLHFGKKAGPGLRLRLVLNQDTALADPANLPLPYLHWEGARAESGTLALVPRGGWHVERLPITPVPVEPASRELAAGEEEPALFWRYRGKAPAGTVRLLPPRPRFGTDLHQEIRLQDRSWTSRAVLDLEPMRGLPRHLDVLLEGRPEDRWRVESGSDHSGRPVRLERLPDEEFVAGAILPGLPFEQLPLLEWRKGKTAWRLHFDEPSPSRRRRLVLIGEGKFPGPRFDFARHLFGFHSGHPLEQVLLAAWASGEDGAGAPPAWNFPLLAVAGGERRQAEYRIRADEGALEIANRTGLREITKGGSQETALAFREEGSGAFPTLAVRMRPNLPEESEREICADAELLTMVGTDRPPLHRFRFTWHTRRRTSLTMRIPGENVVVVTVRTNGRWQSETVVERREGTTLVRLGCDPEVEVNRFEVIYTADDQASAWLPWTVIEAPVPILPAVPLELRRRWLLERGLAPLRQETLVRRPGGATRFPLLPSPERIWRTGQAGLLKLLDPAEIDFAARPSVRAVRAAQTMQGQEQKETTLGRALESLFLERLKEARLLVVDRLGLEEAGIRPSTPVSTDTEGGNALFWRRLGLELAPFGDFLVLTVPRRLKALSTNPDQPALASDLERFGMDRTGTLTTLAVWMGDGSGTSSNLAADEVAGLSVASGTEWLPLAGRETDRITIVRTLPLQMAAGVLSLLLLGGFWRGRRASGRLRLRLLILLGGSLVLGSIWIPITLRVLLVWPLLTLVGVALWWHFRAWIPHGTATSTKGTTLRRHIRGGSTALPCLLAMGALWSAAAQPEGTGSPFTIYLLQETGRDPLALVEPELLQRLKAISERDTLAHHGAVPIAAHLQGKVASEGDGMRFQVRIDLHNFADTTTLNLPLGGAELLDGALLDGAPILPVVATAPHSGFSLTIKGKGMHRLTLPVAVRAVSAGEHREIRIALPRTPRTSLELTAPREMGQVQVLNAQGQDELDQAGDKQVLRADIGREGLIHLRWKAAAPPPAASPLEVKELYLWDLRPMAGSVTGILAYSAGGNGVSHLAINLPDRMEVRSLAIRRNALGVSEPVPTKRWYLTGKGPSRQLHLETVRPTIGQFQVVLDLLPSETVGPGPIALRLPLPLKARPTDGFLAYRLEGYDSADKTLNLGVTGLLPDQFARVWAAAGQGSDVVVTRAYSYRRTSGQAGLNLATTPPRMSVLRTATWKIGRRHADFEMTLDISGSAEERSFLEIDVPAGHDLLELTGPGVRSWTRRKNRVQVWSKGTDTKNLSLRLTGWVDLAPSKGKKTLEFRPQFPQVLRSTVTETVLKTSAYPGRQAEIRPAPAWRSDGSDAGGNLVQRTTDPKATAAFSIAAAPSPPRVRMAARVELHREEWRMTVTGRCLDMGKGKVDLRFPWTVGETHLEAEGAAAHKVGPGHWILSYGPETPRPLDFRLWARRPKGTGNTPVSLAGPVAVGIPDSRTWCATADPDVEALPNPGLVPAASVPTWLDADSGARGKASVWSAGPGNWTLQVREKSTSPTEGHALLAADLLVRRMGLAWRHQARLSLAVGADFLLEAALPQGTGFQGATLDGRPVSARTAGAGKWRIPITRATRPRTLTLHWVAFSERNDRPPLGLPVFAELKAVPWSVRLEVPTGYRPTKAGGPTDLTLRSAVLQERTRWVEWLQDHALVETEKPLNQALNAAKASLERLDRLESAGGVPEGEEVKEPLRSARMAAGLLTAKVERPIAPLDDAGPPGLVGYPQDHHGPTLVWWTEGSLPETRLVEETVERRSDRRMASDLVVIVVFGLLVLTALPGVWPFLQALWPEELLLAAMIGTLAWGWSPLGLLLAVGGILGRMVLLLGWLRRRTAFLFRNRAVEMPGAGSFTYREAPGPEAVPPTKEGD